MWKKIRWRYKLPIIIGTVYILLSLPFIFGLLTPSIHEGNFYSTIYILINLIPILLLGKLIDWLAMLLFKYPTLYKSNLISVFLTLVFWILLSWILGTIIDIKKTRKMNELSL